MISQPIEPKSIRSHQVFILCPPTILIVKTVLIVMFYKKYISLYLLCIKCSHQPWEWVKECRCSKVRVRMLDIIVDIYHSDGKWSFEAIWREWTGLTGEWVPSLRSGSPQLKSAIKFPSDNRSTIIYFYQHRRGRSLNLSYCLSVSPRHWMSPTLYSNLCAHEISCLYEIV